MKTQECPVLPLEFLTGISAESRPEWMESTRGEYTSNDSGFWYSMGFGFGASFFPAVQTGGES